MAGLQLLKGSACQGSHPHASYTLSWREECWRPQVLEWGMAGGQQRKQWCRGLEALLPLLHQWASSADGRRSTALPRSIMDAQGTLPVADSALRCMQ